MSSLLWITLLLLSGLLEINNYHVTEAEEDIPHSRQKRLLWITTDGRLALPPGTQLSITSSLSLPFIRSPPEGFVSDMSISLPFTSKYIEYILHLGILA